MPHDVATDPYIFDTLMRDLTHHDRAPSAFLVYLHLWRESHGNHHKAHKDAKGRPIFHASLQQIAFATGLSKSAVQKALIRLKRRRLLLQYKKNLTAIPAYRVLRPWLRRG